MVKVDDWYHGEKASADKRNYLIGRNSDLAITTILRLCKYFTNYYTFQAIS